MQGTSNLKYPQCNSVVWQIVYHKHMVIASSLSPAILAMIMFYVVSAVSFADHFIPAIYYLQ